MRARRILFGVLLLAAIGLPVWWIFHFPFSRERVCLVVPADSAWATSHVAPGPRLRSLLRAPVARRVAQTMGIGTNEIDALLSDSGIAALVDLLGSRYVVAAGSPARGDAADDMLIMGAWIGGYSQLLRWGLLDSLFDGMKVHKAAGRSRVWTTRCDEFREGYYLSFSVHRGVLVGCLSRDQLGVLYVLPRLINNLPMAAVAHQLLEDSDNSNAPDAFRILPGRLYSGYPFGSVHGVLNEMSGACLKAELSLEAGVMPGAEVGIPLSKSVTASALKNKRLGHVLGNAPSIIAEMPVDQIDILSTQMWVSAHQRAFWQRLRRLVDNDGSITVFACGGEYCGRIMQMKVPAVGVAIPLLPVERNGDDLVSGVVDTLNALWGCGIVAIPDAQDGRVYIVDSVRGGGLKKLRETERPAFLLLDDWLIAISNVDVLKSMLTDASRDHQDAEWLDGRPEGSVSMYGWANCSETSDLMMKALAGYTLVSLLNSGAAPVQRYDTEVVKRLILAVSELGELTWWMHWIDGNCVLNLSLDFPVTATGEAE